MLFRSWRIATWCQSLRRPNIISMRLRRPLAAFIVPGEHDAALPRKQPGARWVADRRVISGIVHVLKIGCRWCDCPAHYGPFTTIDNRLKRWPRRGFWLKLPGALVNVRRAAQPSSVRASRNWTPASEA